MSLAARLSAWFQSPTRLLLTVALWLFALAMWRPLAVPDEGRYTDVARWMLRSGDWVIPRLNGLPFLHKPVLYYWIEAASIALLGPNVLSARVASLGAALVICAAVYAVVRRLSDAHSARWSVLLLASSPMLVLGSQYANLDMLVAAWITVTVSLAALACHAEPQQARWLWWGAYASAGLGVLSKGLIGLVLPGAIFVLWALLEGQPRRLWHSLSLVGALLLAAITLPWFWLAEQHVPGYLHFFFVVQQFERYTEAGFNNAWGPWFYPVVLAIGLLPWSLIGWSAARSAWHARPTGTARSLSLNRLGVAWLLVVLVFFSIPRSKLVGYIFPLIPAAAILLGPWVARWRFRHHAALGGALLCAVLVGIAATTQNNAATSLASALKTQIAPDDVVVFWNRYDYAVPVVLDRSSPVLVVDPWGRSSRALPDNWRRELVEGQEFEPPSGRSLITPSQWLQQMQAPGAPTYWVWVDQALAKSEPSLQKHPVVQRAGSVVVLKVAPQRKAQ